jgi:hypothetical protein
MKQEIELDGIGCLSLVSFVIDEDFCHWYSADLSIAGESEVTFVIYPAKDVVSPDYAKRIHHVLALVNSDCAQLIKPAHFEINRLLSQYSLAPVLDFSFLYSQLKLAQVAVDIDNFELMFYSEELFPNNDLKISFGLDNAVQELMLDG